MGDGDKSAVGLTQGLLYARQLAFTCESPSSWAHLDSPRRMRALDNFFVLRLLVVILCFIEHLFVCLCLLFL